MTHASTHDLNELSDHLIARATEVSSHRAAETLFGGSGRHLRQTAIALTAGAELAEHENPGEATLEVLRGHVELISDDSSLALGPGHIAMIPDRRHSLLAVTDATVLLTVSTR